MFSKFSQSIKDSVEILKRQVLYQGFYRIEKLTLRHRLFEGGWIDPLEREVMIRGHAVAILLFDPIQSQLVFTEQFRIGPLVAMLNEEKDKTEVNNSPWILEISAGAVEAGENLKDVAYRETKEETGLELEALLPICEYWTSPANHSEKISLFCGRVDASKAKGIHGLHAEGEDIQVHAIPLSLAYEKLEQGEFKHAPALIALQWFKLHEAWIRKQWR